MPFHIGEERFRSEGRKLADLAGRLAREAADKAPHKVRVQARCRRLFGSYRPDLFDAADAPRVIRPLIDGLSPHVDLWLAETQGSLAEVQFAKKALGTDPRPFWASFTLDDENEDLSRPKLRSGECAAMAIGAVLDLGIEAILFNCSQPEVMAGAVDGARAASARRANRRPRSASMPTPSRRSARKRPTRA